jgi:hypothetical protein
VPKKEEYHEFGNALDKEPLTLENLESGQIVSLWDIMQALNAQQLISIIKQLGEMVGTLVATRTMAPSSMTRPINVGTELALEEFGELLRSCDLELSATTADRLVALIKNEPQASFGELEPDVLDLLKRLHDELDGRHFFVISPECEHFYDVSGTFLGEMVINKFQPLTEDAIEAGNCFALARYNACVFHLMRIMEFTVQKLGRKFKIANLHKKAWGQILGELKHKIDGMSQDNQQRLMKKDRMKNTFALLDAVCRSTRNRTVHARLTEANRTYKQDEAMDLMQRVRSFVIDFCKLR